MTNEQTIDEIIKAPARETWQYGVKTAWYTLDQVNAVLAAKDAEIAELKADAERYRWLRGPALYGDKQRIIGYKGVLLDVKIDAAMKAGA